MSPRFSTLQAVLAHWGDDVAKATCEPLRASSGYSEARLWQVRAGSALFALRGAPAGELVAEQHRVRIHALQRFVAARGIEQVTSPLSTRRGVTLVHAAGSTWELAPWLHGAAAFRHDPKDQRLIAAFKLLAQVHRAAAEFAPSPRVERSPGLQSRAELLATLQAGKLTQLAAAAPQVADPVLARLMSDVAQRLAEGLPRLAAQCAACANQPLPLQWCLRDVRWEHVLFSGDAVTGLIDWGAASIDTVACDLGRLLSDAAYVAPQQRVLALEAYQAVRPLSSAELAAVAAFERLAIPLAAANWLQWLVAERRWHDEPEGLQRAVRRLAELTAVWPPPDAGAG